MNASLPLTGNRKTAKSEMGFCHYQPEMASFTSFVSASRSAVSEIGVPPACNGNSPLPENLTTRFQKLSLRSTSDSTCLNGVDLDDSDDHGDDEDDGDGVVNGVLSSSDVDMVDEVIDDDEGRISSHRNKFDRIRLDEYRAHLIDHASEVIQSFYETCNVRLDSTNNNSNVDSMQAVLTSSLIALDIPNVPHGDVGISLPKSLRHQALKHSEKPVSSSSSTQDDHVKRRPRKRVSFTSAPSVKWFRKDDRIDLPTKGMGKHNLIAILRQLVLPPKKYREESTCKLKVIPILKKRYIRLKA